MSDPAALFRGMAERIERNDDAEFGGAILVVPPTRNGVALEPVAVMIVDPSQDPATLFAIAKAKIDIAAAQYEDAAQSQGKGMWR